MYEGRLKHENSCHLVRTCQDNAAMWANTPPECRDFWCEYLGEGTSGGYTHMLDKVDISEYPDQILHSTACPRYIDRGEVAKWPQDYPHELTDDED